MMMIILYSSVFVRSNVALFGIIAEISNFLSTVSIYHIHKHKENVHSKQNKSKT